MAAFGSSAFGVVWRNDITETTVLNFGATSRFLGVGMVDTGGGYGTGTFIGFGTGGAAWGITAKHVIGTAGNVGAQFKFQSGATYSIVQSIGFTGTDITIFKMASFASGIFQPGLNSAATFTVGQDLDSAGYGGSGAQGTQTNSNNWTYDNKRRGMQTKLDGTVANFNFNGDTFLALQDKFNSPVTDAANCRPIEGFGAPGDSGSALFATDGTILGVLSGGQFETYGNLNWYAALTSNITTQIYSTTGITPVPEPATMAAFGLGALVALRRRKR